MPKYSYEQRLEAVLNVVEKHMSINAAGKLLGCGESPVRRWVRLYERFGIEGLVIKNGTYSGKFKVDAVEYMHRNHLSLNIAAVELGIPNCTTLAKWERIYYEEGPHALYKDNRGRKKTMNCKKSKKPKMSKEIEEDLIAEVQRLRAENAYLKKLRALVQERIDRENGNV